MSPPRLARFVLRRTLPRSDREDVLTNLDELFTDRLRRDGAFRAGLWYWGQALSVGARLRAEDWRAGWTKLPRLLPRGATVVQDLRYAVRQFVRAPVFTFTAAATLALGVGATAVIYAIVYSAVLRPPELPDPDNLVWVWSGGEHPLTLRQFETLREAVDRQAMLTAFAGREYAVVGAAAADEVTGLAVSANHFRVFGTAPVLGRGFTESDAAPGAERVAVISHELWRSRFGGDSTIVGRRVDLYLSASIPMIPGAFNGEPHTVIGVAPPAYRPFGFTADIVTPLIPNPRESGFADIGELRMVARLRPGVRPAGLRAELLSTLERLPQFSDLREGLADEDVIPLQQALTGAVRPAMLVTLAAVGLVLLLACVNVANLILVRTRDRQSELALRRALGASRARLVGQLLTESFALAAVATTIGMAGATWALPLAVRLLPHGLVSPDSVSLGGGPLGVSVVLLAVSALLCGGLPAIDFGRGQREGVGTSRTVVGARRHRLSHAIVVVEVGISVVLVYAAALLSSSFMRLTGVDTGFSPAHVTTLRIAPSEARYRDVDLRRDLYQRVLTAVRGWPEVRSAGAIHFLPIADGGPSIFFRTDLTSDDREAASYRVITPGYFETMGIEVIAGRDLGEYDAAGSAQVGLVNRALAGQLWPGEDAIGKTLYRSNGQTFFTVVGLVADVRQAALGVQPQPEIYLPLTQSAWASAMTVVVRTEGTAPGLEASLRGLVTELDPHLPITRVATMESLLRASVAEPRFYSLLFTLFGGLAFALAVVGVYGVVAYVVGSRTDEIGLRLALGATAGDIVVGEIGRSGLVLLLGIGLGVGGAVAGARWMAGLLYGVPPVSVPILAATAATIGLVAAVAIGLPLRRASRVDPMIALRAD